MCGIAGIVETAKPVDVRLAEEMTKVLDHRGPDDSGVWTDPDMRVSLGHRRLAILDLSPLGHQPMSTPDGKLTIVFNGEIYNFQEIRADLEKRGSTFRSGSDTEVILAAYRIWGPACLQRFVGMFAFAIWDTANRRLFVARDRAGEKPLFYVHRNGSFAFASELKALIINRQLPRKINIDALEDYLAYGYVSGSLCILDGFAKLPAAHWLTYDPDTDSVELGRYWDLPDSRPGEQDLEELTDELEHLLTQSIRGQLVADVPVGILLSGGLDSSLVAAAAARASHRPIRTFNVAFPDNPRFDESPHARMVARHLGSEHTELVGLPSSGEFLPELIRQYDEPFADSSMIPTYLVSRAIRQKCTVALGGDGGDELFAGYLHYPRFVKIGRLRRLGLHRLGLERMAAALVPIGVRGRSAMLGLLNGNSPQIALTRLFDPVTRSRLTGRPVSRSPEIRRAAACKDRAGIDGICATDFRTYMCDDILVKVDRASMLTSLEIRAPLLDHRIAEFAFGRLPPHCKLKGNRRKIILRSLAKRWLPPEFESDRKQGFSIPVYQWFQGPWKHLFDDLMSAGSPLFETKVLRPLLEKLHSSERGSHRLFQLVALELWRREYGASI
jgi:asparagine synthase (glutamine-hydrolysing)